ncbi:MAG TPA: GspE/PulE family protein, partial [Candidatus Omnitrophota bacterium]|nr:GspE/PulE family protein [Candidatus Omnitrophota bacterium]
MSKERPNRAMRIGEVLLKSGLISKEELSEALDEQKDTHSRLGDIIIKRGFASWEDIAPFLAQYFEIPYVNLKEVYKEIKSDIIDLVPEELARRFTLMPTGLNEKTLTVAVFDPLNLQALDTLKLKTGFKIQCILASESHIIDAIEYCYNNLPRMREHVEHFITEETVEEDTSTNLEAGIYDAGDQPVVQYVKSLIIQGVNHRASDIHVQPKQEKVELRFRIDGVLHQMDPPPKAMIAAITTRVKILSGLDIAERRIPQDGRFRVKVGKTEVDIRVSTFPNIYGESVVMRLLDTGSPLLGLEQLGLTSNDLVKFRELINYSHGLILVTGPTGSGKTTTLYTALNEIKSDAKNIITLEDPVEYRLPFIQQSQVNPGIGFDFARGLRSILRQDPDIIMVGEIRDKETAEIAIHASLTGHLVFSTLHTNDAAGATVRLINMGIEPFLITSSLLGVIAQRLVRTI